MRSYLICQNSWVCLPIAQKVVSSFIYLKVDVVLHETKTAQIRSVVLQDANMFNGANVYLSDIPGHLFTYPELNAQENQFEKRQCQNGYSNKNISQSKI